MSNRAIIDNLVGDDVEQNDGASGEVGMDIRTADNPESDDVKEDSEAEVQAEVAEEPETAEEPAEKADDQTTAEVVQQETEIERKVTMVPVSAVQDERVRRQEAQKELEDLKQRLEKIESSQQPAKPAGEQPVSCLDPNDPPPQFPVSEDDLYAMGVPEYHKISSQYQKDLKEWEGRESKRQVQLQQYEQTMAERQRIASHEVEARANFTAEKMGANMDYDTVITAGHLFLTKRDIENLKRSDDPAGLAYELCKARNPFIKALTSKSTQQTVAGKPVSAVDAPNLTEVFSEPTDLIDYLAT